MWNVSCLNAPETIIIGPKGEKLKKQWKSTFSFRTCQLYTLMQSWLFWGRCLPYFPSFNLTNTGHWCKPNLIHNSAQCLHSLLFPSFLMFSLSPKKNEIDKIDTHIERPHCHNHNGWSSKQILHFSNSKVFLTDFVCEIECIPIYYKKAKLTLHHIIFWIFLIFKMVSNSAVTFIVIPYLNGTLCL